MLRGAAGGNERRLREYQQQPRGDRGRMDVRTGGNGGR